jgi:predicted transcriptional regulator
MYIPYTKKVEPTLKDQIITILLSYWPLRAKTITYMLKRQYSRNISYQAIHKTVLLLAKEGVIEQKSKKYLLSKEWIDQIKRLTQNFEKNYSQQDYPVLDPELVLQISSDRTQFVNPPKQKDYKQDQSFIPPTKSVKPFS